MWCDQTLYITMVKFAVVEIKRMVGELYNRPIISEHVVMIVMPDVHVNNI